MVDKIDQCSGILSVRCMHQYQQDKVVQSIIMDVKRTNRDHHLLFSQIGEKLGFVNENTIREAFQTTWCELYPEKVKALLNLIMDFLPKVNLVEES